MKIVAICGVGVGTSGILKVNAERVLDRLGIDADVTASDAAPVSAAAAGYSAGSRLCLGAIR